MPTPPFQANACIPTGVKTKTSEKRPTRVESFLPHGRVSTINPVTIKRFCNSPKDRSAVRLMPKTCIHEDRRWSDPGPYKCRKSMLAISPLMTRSGKTSMKPSSIDEPTARYKAGRATAMAEATIANEAQARSDVLRKIRDRWRSPP